MSTTDSEQDTNDQGDALPGSRVAWWRRESVRQLLALPPGLFGLLVPGDPAVKLIAFWDIYALVYLGSGWLAFRRRRPDEIAAMVRVNKRLRGVVSRPQQLSQGAAGIAMIAAILTLPRADEFGESASLILGLSILGVVLCWIVLQAGFALAYIALYGRDGGLRFPGTTKPGLVEFAYFTLAVGTTFGTTDVTVTRRQMRRQVIEHSLLAFLFNTLILALTISVIT